MELAYRKNSKKNLGPLRVLGPVFRYADGAKQKK